MPAFVVVDNHTRHPIAEHGCPLLFVIALASSTYHPHVDTPPCSRTFVIPAGRQRYTVTVSASYLACNIGHPGHGLKACLPDMKPPPLPPGHYQARLLQAPQIAPAPPAVPVRVTPR